MWLPRTTAGLAAALQLGRQRRSVIVIDSGEPRNAPAAHMHSYLGHEGATDVLSFALFEPGDPHATMNEGQGESVSLVITIDQG